jgi:hypothetical protein
LAINKTVVVLPDPATEFINRLLSARSKVNACFCSAEALGNELVFDILVKIANWTTNSSLIDYKQFTN